MPSAFRHAAQYFEGPKCRAYPCQTAPGPARARFASCCRARLDGTTLRCRRLCWGLVRCVAVCRRHVLAWSCEPWKSAKTTALSIANSYSPPLCCRKMPACYGMAHYRLWDPPGSHTNSKEGSLAGSTGMGELRKCAWMRRGHDDTQASQTMRKAAGWVCIASNLERSSLPCRIRADYFGATQ
ncbi:hypothetical protein OH77DRAFT_287920 [Trametes cingulata]|nr:hypothetical protein OH77DRAFT_287920 [Trametes cingulata]